MPCLHLYDICSFIRCLYLYDICSFDAYIIYMICSFIISLYPYDICSYHACISMAISGGVRVQLSRPRNFEKLWKTFRRSFTRNITSLCRYLKIIIIPRTFQLSQNSICKPNLTSNKIPYNLYNLHTAQSDHSST